MDFDATEKFVNEYKERIIITGLTAEQVAAVKIFITACQQIAENIAETWKRFVRLAKSAAEKLEAAGEDWDSRTKREMHKYKLDFTRPVIRHQVMDRRPKQLIKKII